MVKSLPSSRSRRASHSLSVLLLLGLAWLPACEAVAADAPAAEGGSFQEILDRETRHSLKVVSEYLAAHPEASDSEAAAEWLFATAIQQGLEVDVLPTAAATVKQPGVASGLQRLARQALALGLARTGKVDEAVEQFSMVLIGAQRQQLGPILPFAHSLAARLRVAGNVAAARKVYEKLQDSFPLNDQLEGIISSRLARMDLIGKAAPAIEATDVDGKKVSLGAPELSGKVVLIDFWATNCRPCLEEMPRLKKLYQELHPAGFEIVGISLDEDADRVKLFRERQKLPWQQVLAGGGSDLGEESPVEKSPIVKKYGVKTIPALIVIDRDGKVAQVDVHGNDLRETVSKLLAQKPQGK